MPEIKSVKLVKRGALCIEIKHYADGRYGFDYKPPGENRIKVRKQDVEDAEAKALEIVGAARGGHIDRMSIDEEEFTQFLKWKSERLRDIAIPVLCEHFMQAKERAGLAEPTLRGLRNALKRFATAFPGNIQTVTRERVVRFLDAVTKSAIYWNGQRDIIVSLWRFARKEGYLPAALTSVETMEQRKVARKVLTYSPDELLRLLAVVDREWLPLLVLGAFCGLRPEEIQPNPHYKSHKPPLCWEHLKWDRRIIDLPETISKVGRRRWPPLTDAALAFLADWRKAKGPVVPTGFVETARGRWVRDSGVKWKQDALRHSFASYRLAIHKSVGEVALEMGNSEKMIHDHYLDLKHHDEGEAWFGIRPEKVPKVPLAPLVGGSEHTA